MEAGHVFALTAQGMAWHLNVPMARVLRQAMLVLPLVGDEHIVSLLLLEE